MSQWGLSHKELGSMTNSRYVISPSSLVLFSNTSIIPHVSLFTIPTANALNLLLSILHAPLSSWLYHHDVLITAICLYPQFLPLHCLLPLHPQTCFPWACPPPPRGLPSSSLPPNFARVILAYSSSPFSITYYPTPEGFWPIAPQKNSPLELINGLLIANFKSLHLSFYPTQPFCSISYWANPCLTLH